VGQFFLSYPVYCSILCTELIIIVRDYVGISKCVSQFKDLTVIKFSCKLFHLEMSKNKQVFIFN